MLLPRIAIGDSWPVNSLGVGADIPPQYRLERMTNRAAPIKGCNPLDLGEPSPFRAGGDQLSLTSYLYLWARIALLLLMRYRVEN